jgi:tetraacyldisaccharide 4'-kinase
MKSPYPAPSTSCLAPSRPVIAAPLIRPLLYLPAKLYEQGLRARLALYEQRILKTHRLGAPVISVGNVTVGGTGKTPCVAFLARLLRDAGHDVAILSRGYKRESRGRVEVSDGKKILRPPREAGDEPYLLALSCPGVRVVVDRDRCAAGRWLEARARVSAFILDDGYQHVRLARDLNLVLLDATDPTGGGALPPFGRLREPLAGLSRADAVIVTRSGQAFDAALVAQAIEKYCRPHTPVFHASHEVTGLRLIGGRGEAGPLPPTAFAEQPVAALSGVARPETFISDLLALRMKIVLRRDFGDHHRYTREEFSEFAAAAQSAGAAAIITTEKDAANLPTETLSGRGLPVYASRIEFRCREEEELKGLVRAVVGRPGQCRDLRPSA